MKREMFEDLLDSVREAGAILRGRKKASRRLVISAAGVRTIRERTGRRTTITQEHYFERLESASPGSSQDLKAFLDDVAKYHVSADFGADCMVLRWRPENGKSWNLGTIASHGEVWMDYLGQQAKNAGLLEAHKEYLEKLKALVPDAVIRKAKKEAVWNIARNGRSITIDALLADGTRRDGWIRAIAEFQKAVSMTSPDS